MNEPMQASEAHPSRLYFWKERGRYLFDAAFCTRCGSIAAHCERCGHQYGQPLALRARLIAALIAGIGAGAFAAGVAAAQLFG